MKVRTGFVSNSSSSSFIMGIGVVSNLDEFKKWQADNSVSNIDITRLSEIKNNTTWTYPNVKDNIISLESFNSDIISCDLTEIPDLPTDEHAKDLLVNGDDPWILWFEDSGDDPIWDEETEEYNYDEVYLDWFEISHKTMYKGLNAGKIPGIVLGEACFGAGYDG